MEPYIGSCIIDKDLLRRMAVVILVSWNHDEYTGMYNNTAILQSLSLIS